MINTIAIRDSDNGQLLLFTRRISEESAWCDAQTIIVEFFDQIYEDYDEGITKDFVVFFKTDDVPADLEVLPPSSMVATLKLEEQIARRSVFGAEEWDYSEESFPYQYEVSDHTTVTDEEFPSRREILGKRRNPVRVLRQIQELFAAGGPGYESFNGAVTLRNAFGFRKDHTLFRCLYNGLNAYTHLSNGASKAENGFHEPRSTALGLLTCKWIRLTRACDFILLHPEKERMTAYFEQITPGFTSKEVDLSRVSLNDEREIVRNAKRIDEMLEGDLWSLLYLNALHDELRLCRDLFQHEASDDVFTGCGIFHDVATEQFKQLARSIDEQISVYSRFTLPEAIHIEESTSEKARQELELIYRKLECDSGLEFDFLRRIHVI